MVKLITDADFNINTTIEVEYIPPRISRAMQRAEARKPKERRDIELFDMIASGECEVVSKSASKVKTVKILPLNALLLLVKNTVDATGAETSSPYYTVVQALIDSQPSTN